MNIKQEIENVHENVNTCLPAKKEVTDDENLEGTSVVKIKVEVINEDINRENNENEYGYQHLVETGTYYHVPIKTEPIHGTGHPETTLTVENKTEQRAYAPRAGGYNCVICGDTFKWKKSLEQHMKKHAADDRQVEAPTKSCMVTIKQEMDECEAGAYPLATHNHSAHIKIEPADYIADADEMQTIGGKNYAEIVVKIKQETEEVGFGSVRPVVEHLIHTEVPLNSKSQKPITRPFEDIFQNKPTQYRCNTCHITFGCENLFTSHMKTHKDKKFMCSVCGFESVSRRGMSAHEKSHTHIGTINLNEEEDKYKCTTCEFKTGLKKCLTAHERERHTVETFYECDYCGRRCINKVSLSRHIRAHTGDLPCQCDYCDYKVVNKSTLLRHMRMHTGDKPYRCSLCGYKTATRSRLTDHKRIHTGETYNCTYCDFKTVRQLSLLWHLRRKHLNQKPLNQTTSVFDAASKKYLTISEKRRSGKKPHECSVCDYVAYGTARLKQHMKRHTNEKPHDCSMCDFKTSHKGALALHLRTHTGEKPFECSLCDFRTAHIGTIKLHERTHTGEKPYACNMCNYKSAYLASFTRHERIHTGEKPFACSICDFKTRGQGNLARHKRIHTGEKPFECSVCSFKTAHRSSLTKHNRTVHMQCHTDEKS